MAVGTDSFPFRKCIIHNIQTRKIWYYSDTCLRVPFNGWEHSRGRRGHRTIDINDRRVLWVGTDDYDSKNALYTILDSENMIFLYMLPSTPQSVGAQPRLSGPSDN